MFRFFHWVREISASKMNTRTFRKYSMNVCRWKHKQVRRTPRITEQVQSPVTGLEEHGYQHCVGFSQEGYWCSVSEVLFHAFPCLEAMPASNLGKQVSINSFFFLWREGCLKKEQPGDIIIDKHLYPHLCLQPSDNQVCVLCTRGSYCPSWHERGSFALPRERLILPLL